MKIEVNDTLFSDLAKKLKTTPENVVKVFLDHAKDLPHPVLLNAIQKTSSLDTALENLMKNAEPAYLMGEIIEKIVGDRDYIIDDSGYDFEKGIFWFMVAFLEGDTGELDSVHLQFGDNSVISGMFSVKDVVLKKNIDEIKEEIYETIEFDIDDEFSLDIDWLDENWISFDISIFTENILDLPKVSTLEKIAGEIKTILKKNDERTKLK